MSIHSQIHEKLREGIESGRYPVGSALPSLRTLSREYNISQETIRLALNLLKGEGRIISRQGLGNFVAEEPLSLKDVMVIGPLKGHLYADYLLEFTRIFSNRRDIRLIAEDVIFYDDKDITPEFERRRRDLEAKIEEGLRLKTLDAIFFNGESRITLDFLAKYTGRVKLFCFADQAQLVTVPAPSVTVDFFHGGYIGVRHLIECGCRHVLIDTFPEVQHGISSHKNRSFLSGCQAAADECGRRIDILEDSTYISDSGQEHTTPILKRFPKTDGVFFYGDYRAKRFFAELREKGLRAGTDVALLGFYNTPWVEAFDPPLSSIETFPSELVKSVAQMYFSENSPGEYARKIAPKLVVRQSTRMFRKTSA